MEMIIVGDCNNTQENAKHVDLMPVRWSPSGHCRGSISWKGELLRLNPVGISPPSLEKIRKLHSPRIHSESI